MSLADIILERRLELRGETGRGRANEDEGRRGGRRVKKASGGGWDLLRAYKRRSWVGVATQLGKDLTHTAPFSCTAHLACLNVHMGESPQLQV